MLAFLLSLAFADDPNDIAARISRIGDVLTAVVQERDAYIDALNDAAAVGNPEVNAVIMKHMATLKRAEKKRNDAINKIKP